MKKGNPWSLDPVVLWLLSQRKWGLSLLNRNNGNIDQRKERATQQNLTWKGQLLNSIKGGRQKVPIKSWGRSWDSQSSASPYSQSLADPYTFRRVASLTTVQNTQTQPFLCPACITTSTEVHILWLLKVTLKIHKSLKYNTPSVPLHYNCETKLIQLNFCNKPTSQKQMLFHTQWKGFLIVPSSTALSLLNQQ